MPKRRKKKPRDRNHKARRRDKPGMHDGSFYMPEGYSTPIIHTFSHETIGERVPLDRRITALHGIGEEAAKRLATNTGNLNTRLQRLDPYELLAAASFYCLFHPIGTDSDVTKDGRYSQAVVEILQSACLARPLTCFERKPTFHPQLFELLEIAKSCLDDAMLREFADVEAGDNGLSAVDFVSSSARGYTRGIRNWGYPQHMRRIVRELFKPLESEIAKSAGVTVDSLIHLTDSISAYVCAQAMSLIESLRPVLRKRTAPEMASAFSKFLGEDERTKPQLAALMREQKASTEQARIMMIAFMHQFFLGIFTLSIEKTLELCNSRIQEDSMKRLLDGMSLSFGSLSDTPFEHLLTQSPIRLQPLIPVAEDAYFVPIPGLLNSFCMELAEGLIDRASPLWDRYLCRRSEYLEEAATSIIPQAQFFRIGGRVNLEMDRF